MFYADEEKTKKFGKTLRELREMNNLSYRDVTRLSGVDSSTLSRLEEGHTFKINVLTIKSLAKLYKVNLLKLLKIIDYVSDEDISEYINISNSETKAIENNEIEILNEKGNPTLPKKFLKLPFENNEYKAVEFNNHFFIFNNSDLHNNDLGIFFIKKQIFIAYYYSLDNIITFKDYFSNDISMYKKDEFIIFGNVKTIIDFSTK